MQLILQQIYHFIYKYKCYNKSVTGILISPYKAPIGGNLTCSAANLSCEAALITLSVLARDNGFPVDTSTVASLTGDDDCKLGCALLGPLGGEGIGVCCLLCGKHALFGEVGDELGLLLILGFLSASVTKCCTMRSTSCWENLSHTKVPCR